MIRGADAMLAELGSAGTPWLAITLAGPARPGRFGLTAGEATVIDIADPFAVPVTVSPFEPEPGYPVQAHADRLAGLFEAAFGLADPVGAAVRTGLRRIYADCGWDSRTGAGCPGAVAAPAVPSFRQFKLAVMDAAAGLGYDRGMRASVRGFLEARLEVLWAGPAGRFLEGGHPVVVGGLLRGNVLVANCGVADEAAVSFLTGVLLARLAEQAGRQPGSPRPAVVVESAAGLPAWFTRLTEDLRLTGIDVIVARAAREAEAASPASAGPAVAPPGLAGRRSAACGQRCRSRPCDGYELHAAVLLAGDDAQAWPRLWARTLVLAFLTGRPLPRVPVPLRPGWLALSPRRRECLLATVLDDAVTARASALRSCYEPRSLASATAAVAGRMLEGGAEVPFRAGQAWVIPPLRWLHEMERVSPLGQDAIRVDDIAPPLDFGLAGLPDWPGIRVGDRLDGLRWHRLSMASERNRAAAMTALLGEDGRAALDADLDLAGTGLSPQHRPRYAARMMGVGGHGHEPGWLEVVLSWPHRMIRPGCDPDVRRAATG